MSAPSSRMTLTIDLPTGGSRPLAVFDNRASEEMAEGILNGQSYPHIAYVKDVDTIVDIGANVGVASAWFSILYQPRQIIAVEPTPETFALLSENAKHWPAIAPFNVGLCDQKGSAMLHIGKIDGGTNSLHCSSLTGVTAVPIELEDAETFLSQVGVRQIDVLKIDTEGCEQSILGSIRHRLPGVRVIYLEYHSDDDRRWIDALLAPSHILSRGRMLHEHRGELCYVSRSVATSAGRDKHEIRPLHLAQRAISA